MELPFPPTSAPSGDTAPLAERMRPVAFADLVGQETIWSPGSALWRLVETDRFHGLLLWGPPGVGKTSLAAIIGRATRRPLVTLSAVTHGVKDIRAAIADSEARIEGGQPASLVFMDEIHRLSRNQQDALLPALESGRIRFIGATTENPSFEVNAAVLSRVLVFRLGRLAPEALVAIVERALQRLPRVAPPPFAADVLSALADAADGDGRRVLTLLEALLAVAPEPQPGAGPLGLSELVTLAPEILRSLSLRYDKSGDQHFDTISAFIKSIRASQPDAAVYYLARMLAAGEDPMFVARRLVIAASEDIGNANPTALLVAHAGLGAVHQIGMPEARIILAQVTTYLAASPKSNRAYVAINAALADVEATGSLDIPLSLRNAPTALMKAMGHGDGYIYAHDDPTAAARMSYLPTELAGKRYYEPSEAGVEAQLRRNLEQLAVAARPRV